MVAAPCAPNNASQTWLLSANGTVRSVSSPAVCWDADAPSARPGNPVSLYTCVDAWNTQRFSPQANGTILAFQTVCVAARAGPPPVPLLLDLRYCNASVPAASFRAVPADAAWREADAAQPAVALSAGLPACEFTPPLPNVVLFGCARACEGYLDFASAQVACAAEPTCGGISSNALGRPFWMLRGGPPRPYNSTAGTTSLFISNFEACRPRRAPPAPVIIKDGNGLCVGGSFLDGQSLMVQPCSVNVNASINATSQMWLWHPSGLVESVFLPGRCWSVSGGEERQDSWSGALLLALCDDYFPQRFALRSDGALLAGAPVPSLFPPVQPRMCLASTKVPPPFFIAVSWKQLPPALELSLAAVAPIRMWANDRLLFASNGEVTVATGDLTPLWEPSWVRMDSDTRDTNRPNPKHTTDFIPWMQLNQLPGIPALFAVNLSSGALLSTDMWMRNPKVSPLVGSTPRVDLTGGQLYVCLTHAPHQTPRNTLHPLDPSSHTGGLPG